MRKINHYKGNTLVFHDEVVASKRARKGDPLYGGVKYKDRINALRVITQSRFTDHDTRFANDTLEGIPTYSLSPEQKEDFLSLYDFGAKPFQRLYTELRRTLNGQIVSTCPCCTISKTDTFDHIIPKGTMPELCDNPLNLIPCCTDCNRHKSSNWLDGASRRYLNLFLDDLPNQQYLFVDLRIDGGALIPTFYIQNVGNTIPAALYRRIENHYNDLQLFRRFRDDSAEVIVELRNQIKNRTTSMGDGAFKEFVTRSETDNMAIWGRNYWKSILRMACCNDTAAYDFLKNS